MPLPTVYSETDLATYMHATLGHLAADLKFDRDSYAEAVNDALLSYGETTIASITGTTNIGKLRAAARVQAWRLAVRNLSAHYDFSDGGQSLHRSQMLKGAQSNLAIAEAEAAALGVGTGEMTVKMQPIHWADDPYGPQPLESGV